MRPTTMQRPTAAALWLCLLLAPAAAAAEPAALVLDVTGGVAPALSPFDEVDAGTRLKLDPGTTLTLEHYAACEALIVTGGSVSVASDGLASDGGAVVERRPVACASVVSLPDDTVSAGVILRSVLAPPEAVPVSLAPTILVAGGASGSMDHMRIERDGHEIATLPVRVGRVIWPEGGLFLSDGARYRFVLAGGPADRPVERQVEVIAGRDAPGRVVLRAAGD